MRQGRRQRNRGNGRRGGNQRTQVFDSNGPDVRIRGTAYQVTEKYLALAKDSASSGDHVMAESYYQYAEHYQRIINSWDAEGVPNPARADKPSGEKILKEQPSKNEDDLSLPASILGQDPKVQSEEREAEAV